METRQPGRQNANTPKAQATRAQILQAALGLFHKKGYRETTMRDVAKEAGLAVGAAYYYFSTKEELVLAFYNETFKGYEEQLRKVVPETRDFEKRMAVILAHRFETLQPYRHFLGVLARSAMDPESSISPFGPETKDIRDRTIALFSEVLEGTQIKVPPVLRPHFPRLIWLYQMGLLFYWTHDSSPNQAMTRKLMEKSLSFIVKLSKLFSLPLMSSALKPVAEFFDEFEGSSLKR